LVVGEADDTLATVTRSRACVVVARALDASRSARCDADVAAATPRFVAGAG
jgi:hypothetical protein